MNVSFPKCNQAGTEFVISTTNDLQEKKSIICRKTFLFPFSHRPIIMQPGIQPFHWHNELVVKLGFQGELEYCINGDSLRLSGDKILLVKDHQFHSSRTTGKDACSLCINFSLIFFIP